MYNNPHGGGIRADLEACFVIYQPCTWRSIQDLAKETEWIILGQIWDGGFAATDALTEWSSPCNQIWLLSNCVPMTTCARLSPYFVPPCVTNTSTYVYYIY